MAARRRHHLDLWPPDLVRGADRAFQRWRGGGVAAVRTRRSISGRSNGRSSSACISSVLWVANRATCCMRLEEEEGRVQWPVRTEAARGWGGRGGAGGGKGRASLYSLEPHAIRNSRKCVDRSLTWSSSWGGGWPAILGLPSTPHAGTRLASQMSAPMLVPSARITASLSRSGFPVLRVAPYGGPPGGTRVIERAQVRSGTHAGVYVYWK